MKVISLVIFVQLFCLNLQAQDRATDISPDSLLVLFNRINPFAVLEMSHFTTLDNPKEYYFNDGIREYLIQWLNKELYFKYLNEQYIASSFSSKYKVEKVKKWLIDNNQVVLTNRVLNDSSLFLAYLDSAFVNEIIKHKFNFFKRGGRLPNEALYFHEQVKLPIAYNIIHQYWKEEGSTLNSQYFDSMLAMHDPEAIDLYNKYVDSLIEKSDINQLEYVKKKANNEFLYGSYAVNLKLKLLKVKCKTYFSFPNDKGEYVTVPFNVELLNPLSDKCFSKCRDTVIQNIINSVYCPIDKIFDLSDRELEEASKIIFENINEFEKAAQPYNDNLIKEERYWKKNIQYINNR